MGAEVRNPDILPNVPTDHPRIVEGVKTALANGLSKEEIVKRIGAPMEVVESIRSQMKK